MNLDDKENQLSNPPKNSSVGYQNLMGLTLDALTLKLEDLGLKKFRSKQIFKWIHQHFCFDIDLWTDISKSDREVLKEKFSCTLLRVKWHQQSKDGTHKFLYELEDGQAIETVLIPGSNGRMTICVSSQVGCAMGCVFCHTGKQGLMRNLKASEIVGQVTASEIFLRERFDGSLRPGQRMITNIVFMGQGEPLHNFVNVRKSLEILMDDNGMGFGQRKITLSTSGLVPQIQKLTEFPPVNIAISLHAVENKIRSKLMPINKLYDLEQLFDAIRSIPLKSYRWITFEYLLIKDVNDGQKDIDALVDLLRPMASKINLIPFNDFPGSEFLAPDKESVQWFKDQLNNRGIITTIRKTMGDDILAACGQLYSEVKENESHIN